MSEFPKTEWNQRNHEAKCSIVGTDNSPTRAKEALKS